MRLTATDYKKLRRRKRIKYNIRYKSHLKFLSDNFKFYPPLVAPMSKNRDCAWRSGTYGLDDNIDIAYYKRLYRGTHKGNRYHFYKKYSNRVVRRCKKEIKDGGNYKRCFDYWWTVD